MIKKFKFHFYALDMELPKNIFNTEDLSDLEYMLKELKGATKPKNVYRLNGYYSFCRHIKDNVFCFEKHRQTDIPTIGKITDNSEREISLKKDETIIEKNYFLINPEVGYIVYQEKNEGFRAQTLIGYFKQFMNITKVNITQILQKSAYEKLLKLGYIKGIEYNIATPNDKILKEFGVSIEERALYNTKFNISVKIGLEDKEPIGLFNFLSDIQKKITRNSNNIKKLTIKGSEEEDSNLTEVNMLKDILEVISPIRVLDKNEMEDDIISELKKCNTIYKEEIKGLIKNE